MNEEVSRENEVVRKVVILARYRCLKELVTGIFTTVWLLENLIGGAHDLYSCQIKKQLP
jgi:hypothetical protein